MQSVAGCSTYTPHVRGSRAGHNGPHGCIAFEDVDIGRHAHIRRAIIDKDVSIPGGERIGFDLERDRQRFTVTDNGVVVIPKGHLFAAKAA